MKATLIILALLVFTANIAKSNTLKLDTVYLQDSKAWEFYAHYQLIINESRVHNITSIIQNDPKHIEAFRLIDTIIIDYVDAQSIVNPRLKIGVKSEFIARYKLHFYQQMTGVYYRPEQSSNVDKRVPDNIMYVVDRKSKMLKFMKSWNFQMQYEDVPEDIARNRQTIGEDVLKVAQINMKQFERFGYTKK